MRFWVQLFLTSQVLLNTLLVIPLLLILIRPYRMTNIPKHLHLKSLQQQLIQLMQIRL